MIASEIAAVLKINSNFALSAHINPDGDSLGSMLALYNVLKAMGKNVKVFAGDSLPSNYSYLPGYDSIVNYSEDMDEEFDVFIVVDCGSFDRTGKCSCLSEKSKISINIDHHLTNSLFADYNLVDSNSSAAGELIYQIIKLMGVDIRKEEALCLYTAIFSDTGGFRYSNTTSVTHQIAGDLINTGINFSNIYELIYRNYSLNDVKIMGKALSSIELYSDAKIAYMELLLSDLGDLNLEDVNTSEFIDYARDINTVEVALFVKQVKADEYKLSFRSKNYVDVRKICEKYGGGGHAKAAGCTITGELCDFRDAVIKDLQQALEDGGR
ncbi:bifunctional oligoribonuclease and PAP phosphatase NrnA [Oxobacter pfennigii]|uniref:Bifunctional oligoribonuclease and PAP phosphatase NrnA n=1 Tax=Oxobacter pfennigii TaxID=36849 RepID=A0A0P9AEY2_9CLOT|nr:bifunctional oligoribonuclease/PAP phosphatase NrnA [Oxobacter pfennigii]KPU43900.1 bifunctional oligoribonuclease and PAP phosphatase NrnA [Oxobacter pfennigii]